MHKKATFVFKEMLNIYKLSQLNKKLLKPIPIKIIKNLFWFFIYIFAILTIVIGYKSELGNPVQIMVQILLHFYIIINTIVFISTEDGPTYKFKVLYKYCKLIPYKVYWLCTNFRRNKYLRERIVTVSTELKKVSFEINNFFILKEEQYLLQLLIEEMRLPKEDTYDYSNKLVELLYEFTNSDLFPNMSDFKELVKENKNEFLEANRNYISKENIKFFTTE